MPNKENVCRRCGEVMGTGAAGLTSKRHDSMGENPNGTTHGSNTRTSSGCLHRRQRATGGVYRYAPTNADSHGKRQRRDRSRHPPYGSADCIPATSHPRIQGRIHTCHAPLPSIRERPRRTGSSPFSSTYLALTRETRQPRYPCGHQTRRMREWPKGMRLTPSPRPQREATLDLDLSAEVRPSGRGRSRRRRTDRGRLVTAACGCAEE